MNTIDKLIKETTDNATNVEAEKSIKDEAMAPTNIWSTETEVYVSENSLDNGDRINYGNETKNYALKIVKAIYKKNGIVMGDIKGMANNGNTVGHMVALKETKNLKLGDLKSGILEIMEVYGINNLFEFLDITLSRAIDLKNTYIIQQITSLYGLKKNINQIHNSWTIKFGKEDKSYGKFDEYRKLYPKKQGYELAEKQYIRRIQDKETHDDLIAGLNIYISEFEGDIKYMKSAESFIKDGVRKDYSGLSYNELETTIAKSIKMLDVSIIEDYLTKKYGGWHNDDGFPIRKSVMGEIFNRVESLGGNTGDPDSRKELAK